MKLAPPRNTSVKNIEWLVIVDHIVKQLGLPNLLTRDEWKKIHQDFEVYYTKLSSCYVDSADSDIIQTGVLIIWAKLYSSPICATTLTQLGFFAKIAAALDKPEPFRLVILQLAKTSTKGLGLASAQDFSTMAMPRIVSILRLQRDSLSGRDLHQALRSAECALFMAVTIISAIITFSSESDLTKYNIDLPDIIGAALQLLRKPYSTEVIYSLFINFAANLAICQMPPVQFHLLGNRSALNLVAAALRTTDAHLRFQAFECLRQLTSALAKPPSALPDDDAMSKHLTWFANEELFTPDVEKMMKGVRRLEEALKEASSDKDFHKLGLTLYSILTESGFMFIHAESPRILWSSALETLPACSKAIRDKHVPSEQYIADALDLKHALNHSPVATVHELADKAIKTHRDVAYFYYARTFKSSLEESYEFAKKGQACKRSTPELRDLLARTAAECAYQRGCDLLNEQRLKPSAPKLKHGVLLLKNAYLACDDCLKDSGWDAFQISNIIVMHILLYFLHQGPTITGDAEQTKVLFKRLDLADKMQSHSYPPDMLTKERMALMSIKSNFSKAIDEWGATVTRVNKLGVLSVNPPDYMSVGVTKLLAWLSIDGWETDDNDGKPVEESMEYCEVCAMRPKEPLKRCGGCGKLKYCSVICQKKHWANGHKAECKR